MRQPVASNPELARAQRHWHLQHDQDQLQGGRDCSVKNGKFDDALRTRHGAPATRNSESPRHAARARGTQRESEARSRKGTGGRLNGISRAHTAGRVLEGTSGPGGELHGSSEVAGGELAGTSDSSDEPDGTGGAAAERNTRLSQVLLPAPR